MLATHPAFFRSFTPSIRIDAAAMLLIIFYTPAPRAYAYIIATIFVRYLRQRRPSLVTMLLPLPPLMLPILFYFAVIYAADADYFTVTPECFSAALRDGCGVMCYAS